jgi:hypothetical protein
MAVTTWNTHEPLAPEFAAVWERMLAQAPHAHYAMRLDLLDWDAQHGRHARAVIIDDPQVLLVLRETSGGWTSGWPWRPQMVSADGQARGIEDLTAIEQQRVLEQIVRLTGGARSTSYLLQPVDDGLAYPCAATYLTPLDASEDVMQGRFDGNRKRAIKRALKEGYEVVEATSFEHFRGFAELQCEAQRRRGLQPAPLPEQVEQIGESWREWELPWMRLLVAVRNGKVEAGSGFGFAPGGTIDYRANASTQEARKLGVNMLLAWEAMRGGRAHGEHWINWGGSTEFKRHLGGVRVPVWCRLDGGMVWALPNRVAVSWRRMRPQLAGMWHFVRKRIPNA